jgi:hypothetical protein
MTTSPWEYYAALLPVRFHQKTVPAGTGYDGSDFITTPVLGRPILAEDATTPAEQRRVLEAILKISWFPPKVRNSIKRELGRSPLEEDASITKALTLTHRALINASNWLLVQQVDLDQTGPRRHHPLPLSRSCTPSGEAAPPRGRSRARNELR